MFVRSMCMSIFWLPAPMVAMILFLNFGLVKSVDIQFASYHFNLGIITHWLLVQPELSLGMEGKRNFWYAVCEAMRETWYVR